jgi:hypothetical protein
MTLSEAVVTGHELLIDGARAGRNGGGGDILRPRHRRGGGERCARRFRFDVNGLRGKKPMTAHCLPCKSRNHFHNDPILSDSSICTSGKCGSVSRGQIQDGMSKKCGRGISYQFKNGGIGGSMAPNL